MCGISPAGATSAKRWKLRDLRGVEVVAKLLETKERDSVLEPELIHAIKDRIEQ